MNERTPIVHIGYHKTGTTWFQEQFYPRVASHRYVDRTAFRADLLNAHAFAFDPEKVCLQVRPEEARPPILCDENLSGSFRTGGLMGAMAKEMAERIHRSLPEARVVVFIRNQVDMAAASYAQYLKKGGTFGPRRYLFPARYHKGANRQSFKRPLFSLDHFDYRGLIRHYWRMFGPERVYVYPYEAFSKAPYAFMAQFTADLGLEVDSDPLDFAPANAAFRHRTLALARFLNLFTYKWDADKRQVLPLLPSKALNPLLEGFNRTPLAGHRLSPEALLGADVVAFIEDYFAEPNRELAIETGLPLAEYAYPGATTEAEP